jgi:peptide/nickel transport system substrate-binding protein
VLKLIRGEADLLQNDLPAELYAWLDGRDDVALRPGPGSTFAYLGFNLDDPATGQRRVREAIAHAIDREAIIRHLFRGRARPAESVLPPGHWAAVDDLAPYAHDPQRARTLLAAAGYGTDRPLRLTYKTSTDPFRLRIAHVLQQQLGDVGIELTVASYDWGTFFGDIKAGRFQMYSLAWVGVNSPDILRYAFHGDSVPPSGANRGGYRDPVTDRLLDIADMAEDSTAAAAYREAQRRIHRDLVYVPLWYEDNVAVLRDVRHYMPGHDGNYLALRQVAREGG